MFQEPKTIIKTICSTKFIFGMGLNCYATKDISSINDFSLFSEILRCHKSVTDMS